MKKFTLLMATIATLFCTTVFTSCSEVGNTTPSIVGTWEYIGESEGVNVKQTLIFNANGSGSLTTQEIEGPSLIQMTVQFEYTYNEDTYSLMFIFGDGSLELEDDNYEAIITANKLKLVVYEYYSGAWHLEDMRVFTRVK